MGILDGIVEWIAEQVMNILDMINTSVLGALGCDMETFLRYFPAAETFYSIMVALAIGLLLLNLVFQLLRNFGIMQSGDRRNTLWLVDDRGASAYQFCRLQLCIADHSGSISEWLDCTDCADIACDAGMELFKAIV